MSQICPQNLIQQDVLNVCNFLKTLMSINERGKVYKILKDFKSKSPDSDISYFLDELLPWADVLSKVKTKILLIHFILLIKYYMDCQ